MKPAFACVLFTFVSLASCADEATDPPAAGRITFARDQGVSFTTGALMAPGNFSNSDVFASANGSWLKLSSGGSSPTVTRPMAWYVNGGGIPLEFQALSEVPTTDPGDATSYIGNAKPHLAFVVETALGDRVRGWIEAGDAASVTLQWERVVE